MKKLVKIFLFSLILGLFVPVLTACRSQERQARAIQRTLVEQQSRAELLTDRLVSMLRTTTSLDSILSMTLEQPDILFYIFDSRGLRYWSDNWLCANSVLLTSYDSWYYLRFDNAHTIVRWTQAGVYNILTVIPVKYAFPLENRQLRNTFLPPFRGDEHWDITRSSLPEHIPVYSSDGSFLFSLCPHTLSAPTAISTDHLASSFSYQQLLTTEKVGSDSRASRARVRLYFIIIVAIFAILLIIGIWGLVKSHGFRNMRLSVKFQYFITALLVFSFMYIFAMSIVYVRRNYERRQRETLEAKCRYIQSALQNLYFWDYNLSPAQSTGLNIDLRDLSFTYETDIHVYDINGNLIGSSTPVLFDKGLISQHMCTEAFFSASHTLTHYEQIGQMRYLTSYTEFLNGSYVPIGYIAVPSFVSHEQMMAEVDNYLMRLLPPYLVVLILALFISVGIARGLTFQLSRLSEKMRDYRLGRSDNHLEYDYNDEVGELVQRYNSMVDQLELSTRRLARSERDAAWRTMARQIAHEINNPLTPMKLTIQQLQRTKGTERFDEYFDRATRMLIEQIENLSRIASSFSTFAKMPEVKTSEVDIAAKLTAVITLMRQNDAGVPIRYIGPDSGVFALADAEQIPQVFTNILKNAIQALEDREDGDIIVILDPNGQTANSPQGGLSSNYLSISFSDNAGGIPAAIQDKIFTPNFTTKSTGTGLGLAISKNIVEGSDGKICFQTSEKGTKFLVYLKKKS